MSISISSLKSHTLDSHPHGEPVARILASAIQAVEPETAIHHHVQRSGQSLFIAGQEYHLDKTGQILILGLGKAALAMTQPLIDLLADHAPRGLLIPKQAPTESLIGFDIQPGGHPIPNENSLRAGTKAVQLVQNLGETDLLICLISGGGSALMSLPQPGLSLNDMQNLTNKLLRCGARIDEINTLRRRLDLLKGGGLIQMANPAHVVGLILSDVIGNPLEAIASGPTAPDPSTRAQVFEVLDKYQLRDQISAELYQVLQTTPEPPRPSDTIFSHVQNVIIGSNVQAADSALEQAKVEGFHTMALGNSWQGEARDVSREFTNILKNISNQRPFCYIAGGETTVTVRGQGRGGRNQELALAAVRELANLTDALLVTLATDGEDGPTDAAGAVVSGDSLKIGQEQGVSPEPFLDDNDAYTYFSSLGDLLKPGPTGTNVNDLTFLFGF